MTITDQLDERLAPLLVLLNRMRQVRDSIPLSVLGLVPASLREVMDLTFGWVEEYERARGAELERRKLAGEKEGE